MGDKVLFLPHCLNEDYVDRAKKLGVDRGYDVHVVRGGSMMKEILMGYDLKSVESLVGIACEDEVGLAKTYGSKIGIIDRISSVNLTKSGCRNTEFDIGELERKLK